MGCTDGGAVNDSDYNKPIPWVGLYIASASALCALAMAADALSAFRRGKLWFPSRFFALNATTLTVLGVATKLPLDLSTSMPGRQDQLAKLSGTALLCAAVGNLMPSLGDIPSADAAPNVVALAILVVTVAANVCIQMGTGVVYTFLPEHAALVLVMLLLLLIVCSSALAADATKQLLEQQYESKHAQASDDAAAAAGGGGKLSVTALRECVKQYWLMAHTCSPQYVLGRSATCTASGAFCLISAATLLEALVRSMADKSSIYCTGTSDYRWSTTVVLFTQAVAVGVGTIAPAYRWFTAVKYRSPHEGGWSCRNEFRMEEYWVQRLVELQEAPIHLQIGSRGIRKFAHKSNRLILGALIRFQSGVVVLCKLVRLASTLPVSSLGGGRRSVTRSESIACGDSSSNLSHFVIHLEGEEDLVRLIMRSGRRDTEQWIQKGAGNKPAQLTELIEKHSTASSGFTGVGRFDSGSVPSLVAAEPPNCWALPLVTLASIAVALPGIEKNSIESLRRGVRQGLRYIRLVEKHLDARGLMNMREAADVVWLGVDLYDRWLGEDLRGLVPREKNGGKALERLGDLGKECVDEFCRTMRDGDETSPLHWPAKVLAANCMYRVSRTILQENPAADRELFPSLRSMISDIMGACLTNLPRVIYMECFCSAVETREKSVREAALLLGEAENILRILGEEEIMCLYPERTDYIDDWWRGRRSQPSMIPSTSSDKFSTSTSDEVPLSIEYENN